MARRKVSSIAEFSLIRAIARRFAGRAPRLIKGIGDDAAVVAAKEPSWWHVTTDLLAEGVHFDLNTADPVTIGYRAAMANLSDIAAMGAVPRYLLMTLAIPRRFKSASVFAIYDGLMEACRLHDVALIGGDTSASRAGLFLGITLIGDTAAGRALFRHGAGIGDYIYVTGTLGDSLAGFRLLSERRSPRSTNRRSLSPPAADRRLLIERHLRPSARVKEGRWLNQERLASAAIDLSDGLSGDLRHICEESGVGAEIDGDALPISASCRAYAESRRLSPVDLAVAGGEDYELLFTAPPRMHATIERQARARGFQITRIGTVRHRRFGIRMKDTDGITRPMPVTSYEHFFA
ncbi:thiamine-phosphate kinase [Candidatus Nitrospira inopinata]|uniref:Thiamine-monophosphate kinase n=1 Tax=Candidatus Nitrospira inopinata TaxID=1715989 RepID=A0A0S4KUM6_9BACT|nr:thiamine-phosphate kinase [Candidatus Nitrospira inopinata]CUQ68113.1 Thiamine-monophosphate kinase [Candidatus Nitrospira inopinata]